MPVSRLDTAYRSIILTKFFTKGWGKPENLKKLFEFRKIVSNREACFQLVPADYPVTITKEITSADNILLEGHFMTPFAQYLPGLLPSVSETAYFQVLLPKKWQSEHFKPVCLHLAGTGDHFFFRRRNLMAKPLLKDAGIGGILLENPFYGLRKPKDQNWSCLHNVSDIFVMGGCLILESLVLFHWCRRNGWGPFGVTGISMGGHMASLAATNWPEPIVLVPCLSWTTASAVFTRGVMSNAINWELLEHQYFSDEVYSKEIKHLVKIIDDDACYAAGQHFAKNFPQSLDHVETLTSVRDNQQTFIENSISDEKSSKQDSVKSISDQKAEKKTEPLTACKESIGKKTADFEVESNSSDVSFSGTKPKIDRSVVKVLIESSSLKYLYCFEKESNKSGVTATKIGDYFTLNYKIRKPQNIPDVPQNESINKKNFKDVRTEHEKQEALRFMCGIMDECTHLSNFSVPVDTQLIITVTAKDDAYVPREGLTDIQDVWPGVEIRYLNAGHVGAYLLHQRVFRTAITDAFNRMKKKYYTDESKSIG